MKIVKFIPSICSGENAEWEGFISFRSTTYDERNGYIDELADMYTEEHLKPEDSQMDTVKKNLRHVRKTVELGSKHIVEVDLKKKDGTNSAKSVDDLKSDDELHSTLSGVCARIINGPQVGNG